jgi:hypothetical protein
MASKQFKIVLFLNFEQIPGFGWSDWTADARATTAPTQTSIECSKFCSSDREYVFGFSTVSILYPQGINTAVCAYQFTYWLCFSAGGSTMPGG